MSVKVLVDGFEYEGRRYGSLSALASEVTGTRWNGLAFFGLARMPRKLDRATAKPWRSHSAKVVNVRPAQKESRT